MKDHITIPMESLNNENIFDDEMRWKFLKFEVRKFSTHCSVSKTEERKGEGINIKGFEQDLEENQHNQEHLRCKRKRND